MTTIAQPSQSRRKRPARPRSSGVRQTAELIVLLCISVLLVRTFSAEAYVVPTGSMAPTLLGWHREISCPNCQATFVIGVEDDGQSGAAICPNCGDRNLVDVPAVECGGDRVLVEKFLYQFRRPRRWEVAVFHFPGEPSQAYVKRVVGLPGETIRIKDGDVFVNDHLARKGLSDFRAMKVLIHDSRFQPQNADVYPRWLFRSDEGSGPGSSAWRRDGSRFVHSAGTEPSSKNDDWIVYKHWDAGRGGYGTISDFHAYNGNEPRELNDVKDLGIEARLTISPSIDRISVVLCSGFDRFVLRIPTDGTGYAELTRNGHAVSASPMSNPIQKASAEPRTIILEAAVVDGSFQAAVDGGDLFFPYVFNDPVATGSTAMFPVELGVRGGDAEVSEIRVSRDVYYTGMLANTPKQPHGLLTGVKLGSDEFFVLGDNSSVSNDSRFWNEGPVVRGSMFVGKPFLVHLPGELVPLKVFGRSFCWVPDPRRIRYIR